METLAAQPSFERPRYDPNKQAYDDLTTQLAEMLPGNMRTPFEFGFDGHDFYDQAGNPLAPFFENGLVEAKRLEQKKPNLRFETRRRELEQDEYQDQLKMARGELPNTMVVVSDFPPELMDYTHDLGGYNAKRKQTMLRVLAWDGQTMRMYTQSLDRSDRQALETIYHELHQAVQPGELLGQRIHFDVEPEQQKVLVDQLMGVYDRALSQQYGGNWHAGIQGRPTFNTYDFVREQRDVMQHALRQHKYGGLDVYAVAAHLQERYEQNIQTHPNTIIARFDDPFHNLDKEIRHSGWLARVNGKVYNACGGSLGPHGQASGEQELSAAGYGNKTDEKTKYKFDKKMHCVVCQTPPKKDAPKKDCGPCGICRRCDKKMGGAG